MKIKTLKPKKKLLLSLILKKFQVYKNTLFCKVELKFKQSLQIIYEYHLKKKYILFIGLPYCNNHRLINSSKHSFVTKNLLHKYLHNKSRVKNISLVVFFNFKIEDLNLLKELKVIKKPLIVIGQTFLIKNSLFIDYDVDINLQNLDLKQFCSFLLYSTVKNI